MLLQALEELPMGSLRLPLLVLRLLLLLLVLRLLLLVRLVLEAPIQVVVPLHATGTALHATVWRYVPRRRQALAAIFAGYALVGLLGLAPSWNAAILATAASGALHRLLPRRRSAACLRPSRCMDRNGYKHCVLVSARTRQKPHANQNACLTMTVLFLPCLALPPPCLRVV